MWNTSNLIMLKASSLPKLISNNKFSQKAKFSSKTTL